LPSVNLKETDKKLKLISCSWFEKQDFKVEVENNMLSISSRKEKKREKRQLPIEKNLITVIPRSFSLQTMRMKIK
jgi:HSP20 family molecular chaperone IbpA